MDRKTLYKYIDTYIKTPSKENLSDYDIAKYIFEVLFVLNQKFGLKIPENIQDYNMSCIPKDIVDFVMDLQEKY